MSGVEMKDGAGFRPWSASRFAAENKVNLIAYLHSILLIGSRKLCQNPDLDSVLSSSLSEMDPVMCLMFTTLHVVSMVYSRETKCI